MAAKSLRKVDWDTAVCKFVSSVAAYQTEHYRELSIRWDAQDKDGSAWLEMMELPWNETVYCKDQYPPTQAEIVKEGERMIDRMERWLEKNQ